MQLTRVKVHAGASTYNDWKELDKRHPPVNGHVLAWVGVPGSTGVEGGHVQAVVQLESGHIWTGDPDRLEVVSPIRDVDEERRIAEERMADGVFT